MRADTSAAFLFATVLTAWPSAAVWSQSSVAPAIVERRIAPATANAKITRWTANYHVWLRSEPAPSGTIMLLLPGSNGQPRNFRLIGSLAASLGYRTIGLMYPDDHAVLQACRRDRDSRCMERVREEIIAGADKSSHVSVD